MAKIKTSGKGAKTSLRALLGLLQRKNGDLVKLKTLVLSGAPGATTVGKRGQIAILMNEAPTLRKVYCCVNSTAPYEWVEVANNDMP